MAEKMAPKKEDSNTEILQKLKRDNYLLISNLQNGMSELRSLVLHKSDLFKVKDDSQRVSYRSANEICEHDDDDDDGVGDKNSSNANATNTFHLARRTEKLKSQECKHTSEKYRRNTSTPKRQSPVKMCSSAFLSFLNDDGNCKNKKKFNQTNKAFGDNGRYSVPKTILLSAKKRSKNTKKSQRVSFCSTLNKKHLVSKHGNVDTSMMGYDWIAGMLDNDSYIDDQSDEFFKGIEEFRRTNRDECKMINLSMSNTPDKSRLIPIPRNEDKENLPLCCNGSAYMLNNRLNPIPIHGPYSECPVCKTKPRPESEYEGSYVRVSVPRSTLQSPYRIRPHRRKSYEPSDSVALSMHCLAGWQNSKPAYNPGPSNIDLRSHASKTELTSLKTLRDLNK